MKKLLLIAAVLLLCGCNVEVHSTQIRMAEELCADYGGIHRIDIWTPNKHYVGATCVDGTYVSNVQE